MGLLEPVKNQFTWRMGKLVKKMYHDLKTSFVVQEEDFEDPEIPSYVTSFVRRDENGLYLLVDQNRNVVNVGEHSTTHNEALPYVEVYLHSKKQEDVELLDKYFEWTKDTCYSTYYQNKEECYDYNKNCVNEEFKDDPKDDLNDCIQYLKGENFNKDLRSVVNKMHPYVVFKTLKKLGFRAKPHNDDPYSNGRTILKVQNYDEWMNDAVKKANLDSNVMSELATPALRNYLTHLVWYMNSKPDILNENYSGNTMESKGKQRLPQHTENLQLKKRRKIVGTGMERFGNLLEQQQRIVNFPPNLRFTIAPGLNTAVPIMLGGDGRVKMMYVSKDQNGGTSGVSPSLVNDYQHNKGARYLRKIFNNLMNELKNKNKRLTDKSYNKIQKNINKLINLENNVALSLKYIELGNDILDAMRGSNQATQEVFSEATLRKFVQKNKHLTDKYHKAETDLYSIVMSFLKAQMGQEPDMVERTQPLTWL